MIDDRVALSRIIRATREFQAGAAFGLPVDAFGEYTLGIADAIIAAGWTPPASAKEAEHPTRVDSVDEPGSAPSGGDR